MTEGAPAIRASCWRSFPGEHPLLARRVNYFESPGFSAISIRIRTTPRRRRLPELQRQGPQEAELMPLVRTAPPPGLSRRAKIFLKVVAFGFGLVSPCRLGCYWCYRACPAHSINLVCDHSGAGLGADAAYARGVADFDAQQAWFDGQTGDRRAGADYWSANRNVRAHASCARAAENYSDDRQEEALFAAGCQDAKRVLDPIDARRADPQYRAGFNNEAKR